MNSLIEHPSHDFKVSEVVEEKDKGLSKIYGRYKRYISVNYMNENEDFVLYQRRKMDNSNLEANISKMHKLVHTEMTLDDMLHYRDPKNDTYFVKENYIVEVGFPFFTGQTSTHEYYTISIFRKFTKDLVRFERFPKHFKRVRIFPMKGKHYAIVGSHFDQHSFEIYRLDIVKVSSHLRYLGRKLCLEKTHTYDIGYYNSGPTSSFNDILVIPCLRCYWIISMSPSRIKIVKRLDFLSSNLRECSTIVKCEKGYYEWNCQSLILNYINEHLTQSNNTIHRLRILNRNLKVIKTRRFLSNSSKIKVFLWKEFILIIDNLRLCILSRAFKVKASINYSVDKVSLMTEDKFFVVTDGASNILTFGYSVNGQLKFVNNKQQVYDYILNRFALPD